MVPWFFVANPGKQNVKLDGPKVKSGGHDPVLDMRASTWVQDPFNCDNIGYYILRYKRWRSAWTDF